MKDKAFGVEEKKEGFKFTLPTIDIRLPSSLHIPLPHDLAPSVSEEEKAQLVKEQTELEKEEKRLEEMKKEVEEVQKQKEEELSHREEDAQKIHTESQMTHDKLLEMEKIPPGCTISKTTSRTGATTHEGTAYQSAPQLVQFFNQPRHKRR